MNKRVDVHLKMYTSVEEICKLHESVWSQVPAFAAAVNQFQTELQKLKNDATKQESTMSGVTQLKYEKLDFLFDRVLLVHAALANHGRIIEDDELILRNKVNRSDIKRLTIVRLGFHFDTVKSDLTAFGDQLEPYGVTPTMLTETLELLDEAENLVYSTRFKLNQRSQLTKSLTEQMASIDGVLKVQVDPFVRLFKQDSPEFFSMYWKARKFVYTGSKKPNGKSSPPAPDDGN